MAPSNLEIDETGWQGFEPRVVCDPRAMAPPRPMLSRAELDQAFSLARRLASNEAPSHREGHRVFSLLGSRISWRDLKPGEHAVIGPHEQCDLPLGGAGELQTRHAIAISVTLSDGSSALRFLDLHTTLPFFLHDDEAHHSLVVTDAFAVRLGQNVVGAIPLGQIEGDLRDSEPPPSSEIEVQRTAQLPKGSIPSLGRILVSSLPPPRPISSYSSTPPSAAPSAQPAYAGRVNPQPSGGAANNNQYVPISPNSARVTVRYGGQGASVEVPMDAFDHGLLLGRAPHCEDGGLRSVLPAHISRVHLLLLRENEAVMGYDLCSLNGTFHHGVKSPRVTFSTPLDSVSLSDLVLDVESGPTLH